MAFVDVFLKITATQPGPPQLPSAALRRLPDRARQSLKGNGLNFLLGTDEAGNEVVREASHDHTCLFIADLVTSFDPPATDGPHLMVRFASERAKAAWAKRAELDGLEVVAAPGTIKWFGDLDGRPARP